ncbi:hypothetical protein RB614_19585 [Phytohabitans sp. ZYX-F-186]|uniref:Lipoprotein LpqB beta-propeller domain-containing protein n=1 Tax=Phytohabitans maris TaxID=3071409 RepID=A0ABU0ZI40_9ACTN|nr:hypothetical protein [Phytohabitans sp. ZYX-F-186]MDQ7906721.1 hypothetical protein [Phytohabitans sp. ZYX-F-186]
MTLTAGRPVVPAPRPGRHPRPRRTVGLAALGVALAAAGTLLALSPGQKQQPTGPQQPRTVAEVWPDAERADLTGGLPEGPLYSPVYFLDAKTSLGTAPEPGGTHQRLVLRAADGSVRELRRLPVDGTPQFGGFVRSGDEVAWAESVSDAEGIARTRMWIADVASGGPARLLTEDTGDVVLFNSEYDMVIAGGRLHWVSVSPQDETSTEVRSVPLSGGTVSVRTEPGAWALSAWPWLVSAGSGQTGPVQLRNLDTRQVTTVGASATELATCGPTWCRVLVLAGDGPSRIDLMRPDGSDRRRVAGGAATASVIDVALLDRFEVLSQSGGDQSAPISSQQLLLYDLKEKRVVAVADGVGIVQSRGGLLWWSTGDNETTAWHTLDLRTLK